MAVVTAAADESPTHLMTGLSKFTLSEESLYTKGDLLGSIQQNIIGLFQEKGCIQKSLTELHTEVKALLATEAGQFLGQYYEERLLKKGMWLLREELKDLDPYDLLLSVADTWNTFYTETLPWLQAIMVDVPIKERTIRQATLLAFRDEMLFKIAIPDALKAYVEKGKLRAKQKKLTKDGGGDDGSDQDDVHAALVQMFLVLLSVNKGASADEKYKKLEALAATLISPLVTLSGIYYDGRLNSFAPAAALSSGQRFKAATARGNWRRMHSSGDLVETLEGEGGQMEAAATDVGGDGGHLPRRQSAAAAAPAAREATAYGRTQPAANERPARVTRRPRGAQRRLLPLLPVEEGGARGDARAVSAAAGYDLADSPSRV